MCDQCFFDLLVDTEAASVLASKVSKLFFFKGKDFFFFF